MQHHAFFDQHTIAQPLPHLMEVMRPFYEQDWQSPYSPHAQGQKISQKISHCYKKLYQHLQLKEEDTLIMTSSGAEAINHITFVTYLNATRQSGKNHFITSNVDEAPVIMSMERLFPLGCSCKMIKVNEQGAITQKALRETISPRTVLLSISWGNAMTSVIQPIEEIAEICEERSIALHVDVSHILGKHLYDLQESKIDMFSFSSETIHGPRGCGVLALRQERLKKKGIDLGPFILGGKEQGGWRAGNFDVAKLFALEEAVAHALSHTDYAGTEIVRLKMHFESTLKEKLSCASVLFEDAYRLPHISVMCFEGVDSDALLFLLNQKNVTASLGGGTFQKLSLILKACGMNPHQAQCSLSFCFTYSMSEESINYAIHVIVESVLTLKKVSASLT